MWDIAAFAVPYATNPWSTKWESPDVMFTMAPCPRSAIEGANARDM